MTNNFKVIDLVIKISVLVLIGFWCFILIRPFIDTILWSAIFEQYLGISMGSIRIDGLSNGV